MTDRAARTDRPIAGPSLLVIGAGHLALGAVAFRRDLAGMVREGWVDTVEGPTGTAERGRAFWFQVSGVALVLLGDAVTAQERGERAPARTGWALGALALTGAAALPRSGFWALLAPAAALVSRARRA
jgi:hypothetical protein